MQDWLLARLEVSDDDFRQLAARRAAAVRDYILATGQVEPERLFLSDEKPADAAEGRRVTLALN
jgi:outer membrane protein OmpA-like peptidoglycan-associated protein